MIQIAILLKFPNQTSLSLHPKRLPVKKLIQVKLRPILKALPSNMISMLIFKNSINLKKRSY